MLSFALPEKEGRERAYTKIFTGIGWEPDAKRGLHRVLKEEVDFKPMPEDDEFTPILKAILEEVCNGNGSS